MPELHLKVDGMHCASCAMLIEDELEELEGVVEAKASFRKQQAQVVVDDPSRVPTILETIAGLGYRASVEG